MFKLSISINKVNNSSFIVDSFAVWHARLVHLNFKSLKYMSKHSLLSCSSINHENCQICIQEKMTKKSFSRLEKISQILDLVHYIFVNIIVF